MDPRASGAGGTGPRVEPKPRDAEAWRDFLLSRVAAYEEDLRFFSSSILVILGVLVSAQFLLLTSGGGSPLSFVSSAANWILVGAALVLFAIVRAALPKLSRRRNLALNLVQDLLEGADVNETSRQWPREFPKRGVPPG